MFIEVWLRNLAESAHGLDFSDVEDRATFRGKVRYSMQNLKWSGMREIATFLGAGKLTRSRDAALRAISTLYMQRYATAEEKKTPAQLDAEIAEALAKEKGA